MQFGFNAVSGYRKVVDFKNRTSDTGLYVQSSNLNFYGAAAGGGSPFAADHMSVLVFTRESSTNSVTGYVDGAQNLQFVDSGSLGIFSGTNGIAFFSSMTQSKTRNIRRAL